MKTNLKCAVMMVLLTALSCTKVQNDDDYKLGDPPPIGDFTNSDDIESSNLIVHLTFDGTTDDAKGTLTGGQTHGSTSFVAGRKGEAYQGSTDGFISYANPGAVANLTSFTVAFWLNTQKHDGGAQGVFALSKADGSFWGNFFSLIEGNTSTSNKMQIKLHFEKNTTPPVANPEQWIDPPAAFRPDDMYGAWRHVVYTYDEATSKLQMYVNGSKFNLPDDPNVRGDNFDVVDRISSGSFRDGTQGAPLGAVAFKDASAFVIGGYPNHLGAPYNALDIWMLNYTGMLDEFRIYNKAISSQEANALYQLERQGR